MTAVKSATPFRQHCVNAAALAVLLGSAGDALAQSPNVTLDTIVVETTAETAVGPVQGYIANRSATATKTDTPLAETPQSISVVPADTIRDIGMTTVQETVRYVPGVLADAYGPDSRGDAPRIRGSDAEIYLDGMRLQNVWFNYQRADPYTLERVEVLRGPSSVLYGSTTTAGILNLVSKRPQDKDLHELGLQYGSFNRLQFQTDHTGKITADGQWLYRFVGIVRDSDYQTDYVKDNRVLAMPAITWRPTGDTSWTAIALYQKDKTGSSTAFLPHSGTIFSNPNGQIPINRFASEPGYDLYQTETKSFASLFEHRFSDAIKVKQSLRYVHSDGIYRTAYPDNYSNPANPYIDPAMTSVFRYVYNNRSVRDVWTADTSAEIKANTGPVAHKILVGFDYRNLHDRGEEGYAYDTNPFNLYAPVYSGTTIPAMTPYATVKQSQFGVYAQDQIRVDRFIAVASVRRDFVRSDIEGQDLQSDAATSMRFGLMYELPFGVTPYVSYAQSFNPVFGANTCASFCKPTRGEQYEAGFKFRQSKDLAINGAVFDITEKNRLASDPNNPFLYVQTGKVRIRGAELEVLATLWRNLDVIAAYSYLDTEVLEGDNAGKRIETVPQQQASLWAKYRFALFGLPGFAVGAGVRYIGVSWDGTDTIATPGYALYDAMVSYENAHWRFQVNGSNLADKIHVTTCLARGDCFYGNRRTVLSSLTYKF